MSNLKSKCFECWPFCFAPTEGLTLETYAFSYSLRSQKSCPESVSWPKFPLTVVDDGEIWNIPVRNGTQTGEQDVCLRKQRERCTIKHRRTPGVTGRTIPNSFFKGKEFLTRGFMALVQPDLLFLVCRTGKFLGADTASVLEIILGSLA